MINSINCSILCSLSSQVNNIVGIDGSKSPTYLFVGEAPGEEEDNKGLPFVGESGKLLRWIIKKSGIQDYAFFNAVCCRPTEIVKLKYITKLKNRTPTWQEVQTCQVNLYNLIDKIKPKVIITLGKIPLSSLINKPYQKLELGKERGHKYFYKATPIVPTYHPATILYGNKSAFDAMLDDIFYASQIVKKVNEEIETYIIKDIDQFNDVIYFLNKVSEFSADIETSKEGGIIGISFSWEEDIGDYIPLQTFNDFFVEDFWKTKQEYVINQIIDIIYSKYSGIIWHNAMYDTRIIFGQWGIPIGLCQDTRLMWGALCDIKFSGTHLESSLDYLTEKFFPWLRAYKQKVTGRFETSEDIDYKKLPLDVIGVYSATDAIVTFKLKKILQEMLNNNQNGVLI